ncbi:hypothetical protein DPEC_G00353750 [Dallia pectoralis]|uniref:Uncharacterized protein n=1 Tax=Dallia pectoralis TaxID=75939 RepID=A0ACC2F2K6_DALPE|nr:hypothetical protein DPEC_G00353750 [Dallia pectoralis]
MIRSWTKTIRNRPLRGLVAKLLLYQDNHCLPHGNAVLALSLSKKVLIKIYLYHLFELQACPPAVKTGTFSPEQYVRRDAHQGKVVIAKGKNKEPVIVHHLCDNEKAEEPGMTRYYRLLGCSIKPRDSKLTNSLCLSVFSPHEPDILEMKGLLPQDFRSQIRSRRLLAIWKKSDISAVLHLCDRFIDLVCSDVCTQLTRISCLQVYQVTLTLRTTI